MRFENVLIKYILSKGRQSNNFLIYIVLGLTCQEPPGHSEAPSLIMPGSNPISGIPNQSKAKNLWFKGGGVRIFCRNRCFSLTEPRQRLLTHGVPHPLVRLVGPQYAAWCSAALPVEPQSPVNDSQPSQSSLCAHTTTAHTKASPTIIKCASFMPRFLLSKTFGNLLMYFIFLHNTGD